MGNNLDKSSTGTEVSNSNDSSTFGKTVEVVGTTAVTGGVGIGGATVSAGLATAAAPALAGAAVVVGLGLGLAGGYKLAKKIFS